MANPQDDHNEGQADGAKADFFDQVCQAWNPFTSSDYNAGFRNGVDNPSSDDDDGDE